MVENSETKLKTKELKDDTTNSVHSYNHYSNNFKVALLLGLILWCCLVAVSFLVGTLFHPLVRISQPQKETPLVAVRRDIGGNEEEGSVCSRRYRKDGLCDVCSPIVAQQKQQPKHNPYEAMVHPALLAYPKSVRKVLVLLTWDSSGSTSTTSSSSLTEPTAILITAAKELLIQLIKYKPLRYIHLLLLDTSNSHDNKNDIVLIEILQQLQQELHTQQDHHHHPNNLVQCNAITTNTTSTNITGAAILTCSSRINKKLGIHISISRYDNNNNNNSIINTKGNNQDGKKKIFDIVYIQPIIPTKPYPYRYHPSNQIYFYTNILQPLLNHCSTTLLSPQHGILIISLGHSPSLSTIPTYTNPIISLLQPPYYQTVHVYQESSSSSYAMACKTKSCRTLWYASQPTLELTLQEDYYNYNKNSSTTDSLFDYFDVSTMVHKYQRPTKAWEQWFCSSSRNTTETLKPTAPTDCQTLRGFDPIIPNVYQHNFEVKPSTLGPNVGLGLFTKVPITVPSYLMQEVSVHSIALPPITAMYIEDLIDDFAPSHPKLFGQELLKVLAYTYGYGIQSDILGVPSGYFVETSIGFIANHGCNGTYNQMSRNSILKSEFEVTMDTFPLEDEVEYNDKNNSLFNPVLARHVESEWSHTDSVIRYVEAGEELFTNYLQYVVQRRDWPETVRSLRALCNGEEVGLIVRATRNTSSDSPTSITDKLRNFL